jgi:hypothetical protein
MEMPISAQTNPWRTIIARTVRAVHAASDR